MLKGRVIFILSVVTLVILWSTNNAISQKPELVTEWPLDEISGEVAHDVIGGNDGKFVASKLEWVPGKFKNGLKFDGKGYVEIKRAPEMEFPESVTITAWINVAVVAGRQDIVSYSDSCSIMMEGSVFKAFIHQGGWPMANGVTPITPEEWYFVGITYDSTDVKLYVNGKLDGQVAAPGEIIYQDVSFWLGGAPADPGQPWFFNGILDEVQIWNKAMNDDEIMKAYETPPPSMAVVSTGKLVDTWGGLRRVTY